jgi:putative hydrolase of the HAD superfamily
MHSIQAVVFDLGKVLVDFDYTIAARKIAARSTMSAEQMMGYFSREPLLFRYETGLLTTQQFYDEFRAVSGFTGTLDDFGGLFGDIFTAIQPMVAWHAALREQGLATFIFSNTNELAVRHIRRNFPFFADFDGYVLSYEQKAMKPDAKIYEAVERMSGRSGGQILYVDDRPENIEAGASRGWRVVLQESPEKTVREVGKLGLLPEDGE